MLLCKSSKIPFQRSLRFTLRRADYLWSFKTGQIGLGFLCECWWGLFEAAAVKPPYQIIWLVLKWNFLVANIKYLCNCAPVPFSKARAGWLWRCLLMPHLKAGNSQAACVICRGNHGHQVRAVGNVLVVELHRDLVVAWRQEFNSESVRKQRRTIILRLSEDVCVCVWGGVFYRAPEQCTTHRMIHLCGRQRRSLLCWVLPWR